jgi:hypothetical protein
MVKKGVITENCRNAEDVWLSLEHYRIVGLEGTLAVIENDTKPKRLYI